jgi:serine/threonine-protein kinase HipA
LAEASGAKVSLVGHFNRVHTANGWKRRPMVLALTVLGLDGMEACYASYATLAGLVRSRLTRREQTLAELYGGMVFNVLV